MKSALVLVSLLSASALAQQETPPPPPPQPMIQAVPVDAPMEDPGGRVRWGVSGNLGWHLPQHAFTLGLEGRVGYQVTNLFSAYAIVGYKVGFGLGVDVSVGGAKVAANFISNFYVGALAEAIFGNTFFIAGGPVLSNGMLLGGSVGATSSGVAQFVGVGSIGWKPGVDLRLGLAFGRPRGAPTFRRGGFTLGLDAMILFHPDAVVARATADGPNQAFGASVETRETIVTVTPMLMLGYDGR